MTASVVHHVTNLLIPGSDNPTCRALISGTGAGAGAVAVAPVDARSGARISAGWRPGRR
jgi:hypothetical protein